MKAIVYLLMLIVIVPVLKIQYYDPSTIQQQYLMMKMTSLGFVAGIAIAGLVGWIISND